MATVLVNTPTITTSPTSTTTLRKLMIRFVICRFLIAFIIYYFQLVKLQNSETISLRWTAYSCEVLFTKERTLKLKEYNSSTISSFQHVSVIWFFFLPRLQDKGSSFQWWLLWRMERPEKNSLRSLIGPSQQRPCQSMNSEWRALCSSFSSLMGQYY